MSKEKTPVKCFIAGFENHEIDNNLEQRGFSRGMLVFSIPTLGILFRCRAQGSTTDLEFGAFFALLKFVKSKLAKEKIKHIEVLSSNPEFIFSFTGNSRHLAPDSARMKLLKEYHRKFKIQVGFLKASENLALASSADYPSMPKDRAVSWGVESEKPTAPEFKPFQRGISL